MAIFSSLIRSGFFLVMLAGSLAAQVPGAEAPVPADDAGTAIDRILDSQRGSVPLDQQNVDPNRALRDAFGIGAVTGPVFRASDTSIFLTFNEGETGSAQLRIINTGDTPGLVRSVSALVPIEGLVVTDTCPETPLPAGDFCDVAISYSSEEARDIFNVILVSIEERNRSSIEIPLEISVVPLPVSNDTTGRDAAPEEPAVVLPDPNDPRFGGNRDAAPRPLTSEDIARNYFAGMGGIAPAPSGPMGVVSLPDNLRAVEDPFLGGSSASLSVEQISMDPRYPESIASTEATLPVDRDMILTADRVIKAVLDTPFSNVMCGKVVAVVESDVYSATSPQPLIQAGSRVLGRCGTLVQERAGIVWERVITVDGRSIALTGEDSMTRDASGLGGALGRVYRTPFDRYVLPILGTFVDVGAGFVQAEFGEDTQQQIDAEGNIVQGGSARNEGIETAVTSVQGTTQQIITELQDVREVLVVPAGTRIDIEIFEDIYFKDEREVIRLADTVYDIARPSSVDAPIAAPDRLELVPFRPGLEGPVVTVDGRRFVVRESTTPVAPEENGGIGQGANRPTSQSPTTAPPPARPDTQATLEDLNR